MKYIQNSLIAFAGVFSFACALTLCVPSLIYGQKADSPTKTPPAPADVRVVNTPSEPVPIAGTVSIGNAVDSPIPVRGVDETVLALDQTLQVAAAGDVSIGTVDVSAYKQIRVFSQLLDGSNGYGVVLLIPPGGAGGQFFNLDLISGTATRTYEIPGQTLNLRLLGNINAGSTVRVRIYGRNN